ncbi:MAG: BTAD domain-containing putative transcriptional regulator [Vulcanimicrobiaceae bacterium]
MLRLRTGHNDHEARAWAIGDVLDAALSATGADVAEVFLRNDGDSGVTLAGFRGPFPQAFNQITRFEEGQGYPGLVAQRGRPLKVVDAANDGRFLRRRVTALGFHSFLCAPIPGADRPAGSLDVAWRSASGNFLRHTLSLSREAERLALLLEREQSDQPAVRIAHAAAHVAADGRGLELRLLGRFEARSGDAPLSMDCFSRRRAVTLLKILLTNYGKVVGRDELIELLWPADAPRDAANLVKTAVHYLRRGLGDAENGRAEMSFIATEPNGYAFNPASAHWFDAHEFEAAAEAGLHLERRGLWREALVALRSAADLYGGDYLEDEAYSDWCAGRRRRLRGVLFDVLHATARLLRSAGDYEAAIRSFRHILELDPCLEDVHRDLIDLFGRCGRRTQALRQFDVCRQALRDEFGVAPDIETETLYRRILGR